MTLNFFKKCLCQCVFIVILSSCTPGNNNTGKADQSKGKALAVGEEQTDGVPSAEGSAEDDPAVSDQGERLPPPEVVPEAPAKGEAPPVGVSPPEGSTKTGQISPLHVLLDEKDYSFELEDIINAGLLKEEDSDLAKVYFHFWLNSINFSMKHGSFISENVQRQWCHTPDCLNGMDLKKLKAPYQMHNIMILFSLGPTVNYPFSTEENKQTEYIGVFHALLAPQDWKPQSYQNLKEGEDPTHITDMQKMIDKMKETGAKNVIVNLPLQRYTDPKPFYLLGQFMKENQVDLHIVGGCEAYCTKYLIPAAKTIHIGDYGHIYFYGSYGGIFEQVLSALPVQEAANRNLLKEELSNLEKDSKVALLEAGFEVNLKTEAFSMSVFIDNFKGLDLARAQEFQKKLQAFYPAVNKTDVKAFTKAERLQFLGQLSPDILDSLTPLLIWKVDENTISREDYVGILGALSREEFLYYQNIEFNSIAFDENGHYTYAGLLHLAAKLLKDINYEQVFSVSRPYYNVPEEEKLYHAIVPSAELLRSLGLDVRGKNNIDRLDIDKNSKTAFLYLDSKRIDNCGFFKEGVSYKTLDCLFE